MSERCERTNEWRSKWPSAYIGILGCSEPLFVIPPFRPSATLIFNHFPVELITEGRFRPSIQQFTFHSSLLVYHGPCFCLLVSFLFPLLP